MQGIKLLRLNKITCNHLNFNFQNYHNYQNNHKYVEKIFLDFIAITNHNSHILMLIVCSNPSFLRRLSISIQNEIGTTDKS